MRRTAHCLILLLAPLATAAHAADAFDNPASGGCSYTPGEVERVAAPAASVSLADTPPPAKHVAPPTPPQQAGGGSDEEVIPRLRAPKWHRLLPGMFR